MSTNADARPVGTGDGIRPRLAVFQQRTQHFVGQMRVRSAVPATLQEGQVIRVVNL